MVQSLWHISILYTSSLINTPIFNLTIASAHEGPWLFNYHLLDCPSFLHQMREAVDQ